jgi:predicted RNase H-like HicB family nuclease
VKVRDAIRAIEQDEWVVPDLPGCFAVAKTLGDARALITEAIEFHIEGMLLHGEQMPEPTPMAEMPAVA